MISINLNKYNIDDVKHNYLKGTKVKVLTFTSKTSWDAEKLYNFVVYT